MLRFAPVLPAVWLALLCAHTAPVEGTYGFDVSSYLSVSDFSCLLNNSYQFAIIRAYRSIGSVDPNAVANIKNARAAGIPYVDVYLFPCPKCTKSASEQVDEMVNSLAGSDYGQIWLDIEGTIYWGDPSSNQQFFEELLSAASSRKTTGVYTSKSQWDPIMGDGYTRGSSQQLWYAHYDQNPSFSDFSSFGGWYKPTIKQYEGDASVCNVDIDKNWYP